MPEKKQEIKEPEKPKLITEKAFEKKVIELANSGLTAEKIGGALRKEKIHPKEFSKKISKILKENKLYTDQELKNVEERYNKLSKHAEKNKQDKRAIREKSRRLSHIRKIKKHRKLI